MDYITFKGKTVGTECTIVRMVQKESVSLSDIAASIESDSKGRLSKLDVMRAVWEFFNQVAVNLSEGNRVVVNDYCEMVATIKKSSKGNPEVSGIQFVAKGNMKKKLSQVSFTEISKKTD